MVVVALTVEYSSPMRRGPYKKGGKLQPQPWRRTFLREWRELRDLTQEQLAEAAGVSVGLVSSLEAAKAGYSAESLHKLAAALNTEPGAIVSVNPQGNEPLWSIVSRATLEQRAQIARHADVIVGRPAQKKR